MTGRDGDVRRLRFRGGPAHGQGWIGEIDVGSRIAVGSGPWSSDSVYVVIDETVTSEGRPESVAVPVEWSPSVERPHLHNPSVDEAVARVGGCGQVYLPTGATCRLAHAHPGSCDFVRPASEPDLPEVVVIDDGG